MVVTDEDGFIRVVQKRNRKLYNSIQKIEQVNTGGVYLDNVQVVDIVQNLLTCADQSLLALFSQLRQTLERLGLNSSYQLIAIGLGSVHLMSNYSSRIQVAMMIKIIRSFGVRSVSAFDPVFTKEDILLLKTFNIDAQSSVFPIDDVSILQKNINSLVYAPHCVESVHRDIYRWKITCSESRLIFIGNDLSSKILAEFKLETKHRTKLIMTEHDKMKVSRVYRAFNDTFLTLF